MDIVQLLNLETLISFKINSEIISLSELDFLTELFSFFVEFDASVHRQICRWWNDLLTKDRLTTTQIKINTKIQKLPKTLKRRINKAAYLGYLELFKFARRNKCWWNSRTCAWAILGDNPHIVKWGMSMRNSFKVGKNSMTHAARNGNLKLIKRLNTRSCPKDNYMISIVAAKNGYPQILEWLEKTENCLTRYRKDLYAFASKGGHISVLDWLLQKGYSYRWSEMRVEANRAGHLHVLEWYKKNGIEIWSTSKHGATWGACDNDNLEVILWYLEAGYELSHDLARVAAGEGAFKILEWCLTVGGYSNKDRFICHFAALEGHLKILKFAREHGCVWDKYCCKYASYKAKEYIHSVPLREQPCRCRKPEEPSSYYEETELDSSSSSEFSNYHS
jgi:hypothetical protein